MAASSHHLKSNLRESAASLTGGTGSTVRTLLTFVVVMLALLVIWQGVKALFNLDQFTLPHVGDIIGVFFQPIQEGQPILGQILLSHALFTIREAVVGFALGASLGFVLAVIFAHSRLIERGLMPFVVASQTVPILAIAPMVVVWLGPTASSFGVPWLSVAVIAAYLTFFPVTINTLRGLVSVPPTALELMQSYAASRRQILLKLRIPHALPFIFTALKVSATASVVGAIIGELPSGIQDGLGGQIINYAQYYAQGPARLWATNLMAALCGILAFVVVSVVERFLVRWSPSSRRP
jgi:NitT/TauT family transport system permease protein